MSLAKTKHIPPFHLCLHWGQEIELRDFDKYSWQNQKYIWQNPTPFFKRMGSRWIFRWLVFAIGGRASLDNVTTRLWKRTDLILTFYIFSQKKLFLYFFHKRQHGNIILQSNLFLMYSFKPNYGELRKIFLRLCNIFWRCFWRSKGPDHKCFVSIFVFCFWSKSSHCSCASVASAVLIWWSVRCALVRVCSECIEQRLWARFAAVEEDNLRDFPHGHLRWTIAETLLAH